MRDRAAWTRFLKVSEPAKVPAPPGIAQRALESACLGGPISFSTELSLPPAVLSPNVTLAHWGRKRKATKAYRKACWIAFVQSKPKNWVQGQVVVDIQYRCPKDSVGYVARDEMNAMAALKAAIDAMADAGVVPVDTKKWVTTGSMDLITNRRFMGDKSEGVTLTVRIA